MKRKLGYISFYDSKNSCGIIRSEQKDFPFHNSAFVYGHPEIDKYFLFIIKRSEKDFEKLVCAAIYPIENETEHLTRFFKLYSSYELSIIKQYNKFPFYDIDKPLFESDKNQYLKEARDYITLFNPNEFSNSIKVSITTSETKKPGADDSFTAYISNSYNAFPHYDSYLKSLNPKIFIITYTDYGFYSCSKMRADYSKYQELKDKALCESMTLELKLKFLSHYNGTSHLNQFQSDYLNLKFSRYKNFIGLK